MLGLAVGLLFTVCVAPAWPRDVVGAPDMAAARAQALARSPVLDGHVLRVVDQGRALDFRGGIAFGVTREVRAALDRDMAIRMLRLTSPGGRVQEARLLADLLRQRGIDTYADGECVSACAIVFMAGARRVAVSGARLGFHRDRDGFAAAGGTAGDGSTLDDANATDRALLVEEGMAPWFADRAYATPSSTMWLPSLGELVRGHVVTQVVDVSKERTPRDDAAAEADAAFAAIAVFGAIKRAAPDVYAKLRAATITAIEQRQPAAALAAVVAPYMRKVTRESLPGASDAAIVAFAKVLALELGEIGSHSADDCYAFGYGTAGSRPVEALPYLSTEVLLREQAALAALIDSRGGAVPALPTDKDITPSRNLVMERLIDQYGGAAVEAYVDARAGDAGPEVDHAQVCRMTIAFYNEAFTLPPDEQARLLRFILLRSYARAG